mgnify:CR=1 FL=1
MRREVKWLPLVFLISSSLLLLPLFMYPSDWAGWLLVYFSFTLPLSFARIRSDRKLLIIMLVVVAVHNAVSIYNVYGETIFGAGLDAIRFQDLARDMAADKHSIWFAEFDSLEVGTSVYTRFIAAFYRIFGVSLLLGQSLSVIAYTLSCITVIYLAKELRLRFKRSILIVYSIAAPAIIYCSILMREAWQALFFLLLAYLALQLRAAPSLVRSVGVLFSGLLLGMLHNGLFVYSLVLVTWSLYWGASGKWKRSVYKKLFIRTGILVSTVIILGIWFYLGGEIGGVAKAIRSGEMATYTETYRERGEQDAAANYQVKVETTSLVAFVSSGSLAFIYYQFAPFPWQVRRPIDIYAAAESILRLILMVYMFRLWWNARGERRQRYTYLIICYLTIEFLWALGTGNWGTAVRHHLVAYGILALLGTPGLIYSFERMFRKMKLMAMGKSRLKRYDVRGIRVATSVTNTYE